MNSITDENKNSINVNNNSINEENSIKNNINSNNIDDSRLKTSPSPNFIFQEEIISYSDCICGLNESFDVFNSIKDKNDYLIISNKDNNNIKIINLYTKKITKSIEGNNTKFILLKYYLDNGKRKEYLISIDLISIIKIISITDNYNILSKIEFPREFRNNWKLLNCAVLFNVQIGSQKMDIIIVSNRQRYMEEQGTKIYNIYNGQFLKDVSNTKKNKVRFIIPWFNEANEQYYLIELCEDLLVVVSLLQNEVYAKLSEERYKSYSSGFVHKEDEIDYLYVATNCSEINIWNLISKELVKMIKVSVKYDNIRLYGLLFWNENYLVVTDDTNNAIKTIDLKQDKVISSTNYKHKESVRCIKRIKHKIYGECLLTGGDDYSIKLWRNVLNLIIPIFE
jgi:hypothetical protein